MKANRLHLFLAENRKVCSPTCYRQVAHKSSLALPQEMLFQRASIYVLAQSNKDTSCRLARVTALHSLLGLQLPFPHLGEHNSH